MTDEDLYLRSADGARGETLISGPLLGALRMVREVEHLNQSQGEMRRRMGGKFVKEPR